MVNNLPKVTKLTKQIQDSAQMSKCKLTTSPNYLPSPNPREPGVYIWGIGCYYIFSLTLMGTSSPLTLLPFLLPIFMQLVDHYAWNILTGTLP